MDMKRMMLTALRGGTPPHLPFLPRMDVWYNANTYNGTMPERYRGWSLRDILDDLGFGYHAIIPDFHAGTGHLHDGLGFYDFRTLPYRIRLHDVQVIQQAADGEVQTEYRTPHGTLTTRLRFDAAVQANGATAPHQMEFAIKTADDLKAAGYLFDHAEVIPFYDGFDEMCEWVGNRGIVTAMHSAGASPMHFILRVLMRIDDFYYLMADDEAALVAFSHKVARVFDETFEAAAGSRADVILSGLNMNSAITPPDFFARHMRDSIHARAAKLEAKGKLLAMHPDGENQGLLEEYIRCGMHVADSICPAPMSRCTLREIRDAFGEKIAIIGGVPSTTVLAHSMSDLEFERYIEDLLSSLDGGRRLVLSIADTTPPDADLSRLKLLWKKSRAFRVT
jgi:hypothetical protein